MTHVSVQGEQHPQQASAGIRNTRAVSHARHTPSAAVAISGQQNESAEPEGGEEETADSAELAASEQSPDSAGAAPAESVSPDEAPIDPKKTILVVEDDLDTADSLKVKLESKGYNVLTIFDGLQALEIARKIRPALVVLDVVVPGLMGYHVCRLLKFDERFRNIPVIILTGRVDRESRETGTKAGADIYMTKPFELDELLENVRKFIG